MDKELLINNVLQCCKMKEIKPTPAMTEAGVGKDFIGNLRRGQLPSIEKVADLAAYLGVSTSDLVGDARASPQIQKTAPAGRDGELLEWFRTLNERGQRRLIEEAEMLAGNEMFTKNTADKLA